MTPVERALEAHWLADGLNQLGKAAFRQWSIFGTMPPNEEQLQRAREYAALPRYTLNERIEALEQEVAALKDAASMIVGYDPPRTSWGCSCFCHTGDAMGARCCLHVPIFAGDVLR